MIGGRMSTSYTLPPLFGAVFRVARLPCVTLQVALNYLDSQPRPGKIESRLLKMADVQ